MDSIGQIKPVKIVDEMQRSYLDYAMSVIVARALPDVRDGLKPVHRRILYAMDQQGINHKSPHKKSARVVGEVLGKFHPHGDMAVYDALVRMAQDFSLRYPLIDGHGNFGSVDGDSPAAMRYTEARLAKISQELLEDIDKDTVKFIDNFDGSQKEPTVLPANLPNLLLMGADGIAVGMATKIPPHNLSEVITAIKILIKKTKVTPDPKAPEIKGKKFPQNIAPEEIKPQVLAGSLTSQAEIEELMQVLPGPDFPTGGIIYNAENLKELYTTGKGSITTRAKTNIVESKGGAYKILVTQLPYQVNKARLIAKIADLVKNKKLNGIRDIRDESDRTGLQIAIELKRDAKPKAVLNNLFKHTELQTNFPANMVALVDDTPQLLNLKQILLEYLKHRQLVLIRRSQFNLKAAKLRAHILEGLKIALDHLDAVISTIKKSRDADTAKLNLMKNFKLSDIQAQAILDMQLRRLAALERKKIEDEYQEVKIAIDQLVALLLSPQKVFSAIEAEIDHLDKTYGDDRRTKIIKSSLISFSEEDLEPEEECLVTMTKSGYIKRIPVATYRSQRRGGKGVSGMTTKEQDEISRIFSANTHDTLLIFTNKGRVFKLKVFELPQGSRQAKGQAIINLISIDSDETIQSILNLDKNKTSQGFLLMVTRGGTIKKTPTLDYANIRSSGIIALNLTRGDELVWVKQTSGSDDIVLISHLGQSIRFKETDARPMGRAAKGVRGIRLTLKDFVVGMAVYPTGRQKEKGKRKFFHDLLVVTQKGIGKRTAIASFPVQKRGGKGVRVARLTEKTGKIVSAHLVTEKIEAAILTSKKAQVIRLPLKNIKRLGRTTQGVILMRFAKAADQVAAVALVDKDEA
ncbi:MAG: gyrase subunit A protein [Candidatus Beckwithbacteria bacterium GW2011_GWB1_47_15]|uniref:DNA gyrase subunit A n=1 Tax=Candidatus Beckwithbacteria bacterium GW2011_GWB1_47_15 TaxID=1618371 RepID=A0A0G1UUJ0_9BACT|nr:MAG: gyrase subunit A, DNA gyrase subunit A protein [Candidatus Beckwithbacteria bacterium GW2011_GWC1_49_16]KKU35295.1 MAG: gyrase subunit A protein [Candidatus Beckwithbacteria bacterium GW2011_GWA1_46_30]KKU61390.1 MAG: gyrase subunit A protein [Candidatus Beckwithbacteria bacterium GW2011_GWB1_47_15]KKU71797.1 MAG: gyrase subunit A protein [Candidatus Beckwithbacteria bacterium GW2011_GWA2_47_25]KKW03030.1 MAG: gyrase subunit A protein [Candidatus Beckwithbacteria bacterium GW2011_GWC2_4